MSTSAPPSLPSPRGWEGLLLRTLNCVCGCVMLLFAVSVLLWLLWSYAVRNFTA